MFCKNIMGKFATTNSNFEKINYLEMHHRITYMYATSISSKLGLVDQSKTCIQIYLINNRKLHKFATTILKKV